METINTGKQIVQQFNQYQQEDGKASSTVESYAGDIAAFVALALRLKDIDLLSTTLTIAWGKGSKYREVPLRQEVVEIIKEYMGSERKESEYNNTEYLLVTQWDGRMDRDTIIRL